MKKQVLIVADDLDLRNSIQNQMENEAMETNCADSISAALSCVMEREYHLVILDLQLSGVSDIEMVRIIRIAKSVPVLALTDPLDNSEKIVLFEAGMGAFMEKPIAADVCAAQADALIRLNLRSKNEYYYQSIPPIGPSAVISLAYRQVLVEGVPLGLTKKEFDLLHYMVKHPYQIFSKEQLYKQIWNYDVDIGGNENVKTHIKTLRRKLMVVREDMIETVRGVGYRYVPPDLPQ